MKKKVLIGSIGAIVILLLAGITPVVLAQETTKIIEKTEELVDDNELPNDAPLPCWLPGCLLLFLLAAKACEDPCLILWCSFLTSLFDALCFTGLAGIDNPSQNCPLCATTI